MKKTLQGVTAATIAVTGVTDVIAAKVGYCNFKMCELPLSESGQNRPLGPLPSDFRVTVSSSTDSPSYPIYTIER